MLTNEMGGTHTGHVWGRKEKHSRFWMGNLQEKASIWKTSRKWEYNIKMDLKYIEWEILD
jgi:hypothetical protein